MPPKKVTISYHSVELAIFKKHSPSILSLFFTFEFLLTGWNCIFSWSEQNSSVLILSSQLDQFFRYSGLSSFHFLAKKKKGSSGGGSGASKIDLSVGDGIYDLNSVKQDMERNVLRLKDEMKQKFQGTLTLSMLSDVFSDSLSILQLLKMLTLFTTPD